jgi:NADPH:quinone reductase-like Zn-dependent oxidoreductase
MNATMYAVRIHAFGGPDQLKYEQIPIPQPGPGEVLIRVHAAGVNPVDWKVREGYLKDYVNHTLPLTLGWDVSGVIQAMGLGATRFKKDDEVYSRPDLTRDGTYAEYVVVRESEVARKPKSADHIHAASIPLAALTAWQAFFDNAALKPGQRVLIHGAAGGVGTMAVQLAKWKGAYVIATSSQRNQEFLRKLGADETIDYTKARFEEVGRNVDVVFDMIGGDTQKRSWKVLKNGGMLVSIVSRPSPEEAASYGVRQAFLMTQPNAAQLTQIAELVDSANLRPVVETILPLTEARRAQELSQAGHTRGKIILRVV